MKTTDLSNKLRPTSSETFVGQSHVVSKDKALYKLIEQKDIPYLFFYGKPGIGKATLAKIIVKEIGTDYYYFNATSIKVEDLRKVFDKYKGALIKPLIFIDEAHRLSKNQREVLLPIVEDYDAITIGASTENPFSTLTNAIHSRSSLYEFKPFTEDEMSKILYIALEDIDINISDEAREYLIISSSGDARAMLTLLNFLYKVSKGINIDLLKELRENAVRDGVLSSDTHYDLASAMIKFLRGSNVDAALYYATRLINGGESVDFITKRFIIFVGEDIGNASSNALNLAVNTMMACNKIGYPESRIMLSQCAIYLASSPKSNSAHKAVNKALKQIKNGKMLDTSKHLDSQHMGCLYPHGFGGYVEQEYLKEDSNFYQSSNIGFEKTLNDWIEKVKNKD